MPRKLTPSLPQGKLTQAFQSIPSSLPPLLHSTSAPNKERKGKQKETSSTQEVVISPHHGHECPSGTGDDMP